MKQNVNAKSYFCNHATKLRFKATSAILKGVCTLTQIEEITLRFTRFIIYIRFQHKLVYYRLSSLNIHLNLFLLFISLKYAIDYQLFCIHQLLGSCIIRSEWKSYVWTQLLQNGMKMHFFLYLDNWIK